MAFRRRRDGGALSAEPARWQGLESAFARLVMTVGIVGISTALAAILGTQNVQAWVIGLVVSLVSVILAALLWSRYRG